MPRICKLARTIGMPCVCVCVCVCVKRGAREWSFGGHG
ncbi:hypothetical protein ACFW04_010959 [Cataglyphis niger]